MLHLLTSATHTRTHSHQVHVVRMIDELDALRLWVTLRMPKIEDGNNFSVEVQSEVIGMLSSGKQSGIALIDSINRGLMQRGEVVAKQQKYPHVADFARAVHEMDSRQHLMFTQTCIGASRIHHDRDTSVFNIAPKLSSLRTGLRYSSKCS